MDYMNKFKRKHRINNVRGKIGITLIAYTIHIALQYVMYAFDLAV